MASVVIDATRGKGKDVQGLYMVGASAHPGTGVPIVLAGGRLVAEQILQDLGMEVPWGQEEEEVRNARLDTVDKPFWLDDSKSWLFIVAMVMAVPWVVGLMFFLNM